MAIALPPKLRHFSVNIPLRWALALPFVFLTIGAVSLVGWLSYRDGQDAAESLGDQLASSTNDRITQELKTYLQTPLLINRLNVDVVKQGQLDPENIPALEATLFNRLQQFEQVTAIAFVSPQGRFRVTERLPENYLGVAEPTRPQQIQFYQLDRNGQRGKLVATVNNLDVRRDRPFYRRAVTTGQLGWSPISQYGTTEALTLNASQPVYGGTSRDLLGVFMVSVRLDYFSQFLQKLDVSHTGQVIILDQQGTLVATSAPENPFKVEGNTGAWKRVSPMNVLESRDGLTRSLGEYLRDRPDLLKSAAPSELVKLTYHNETYSLKITPYQDRYGLNWRIVTITPQSMFLGAIQKNTQQTVLLSLLTLGTAITMGLVAANLLLARFRQFNQVSQALAAGDLDQRLPTDGSIIELNSLAGSFNQMADQLQQSFYRLKTALENSETNFSTIFRISPDPMTISTCDGHILDVNDSQLRVFGYSREEVIGRTALELDLYENPDERKQLLSVLKQEGRVRNMEVHLRAKTGEVKTILISVEVGTLNNQPCRIVVMWDVTDLKAAELALQQSEARYRAIVEDQTELIARFRPDTTLQFVNDAYCRYFNVQREEVIGTSFFRFVYRQDQEQFAQRLASLSLANPTFMLEERVVVNGEIRWNQWVNRLLFDAQGNVTEIQTVGRDITDLKRVEAALRESEATLLQAQRIAQLGSWELDITTQQLIWSEEMFRITGLDSTQPVPSLPELWQTNFFEQPAALELAVERAIADGTPYEVEHTFRRPDGTVRYVVSKGQALFSDHQQVVKLYGTVLDITERKLVDIALQESEARFRELAETVKEGFFVFETRSAQYSYVNPACVAITGFPKPPSGKESDYLSGMVHWLDNIHLDDRSRIEQALQEEKQGKFFDQEYRFIRSDGEVRWLRSKAYPIQNSTGEVVRIVGTVEDISDRKKTEDALRESEELFRRAFDDTPIGISLVTPSGQFLRANAYYCQMLGYTEAELLNLTFQEITHPADLHPDLEGFQQMLSGEKPTFQMEKRYLAKDGTIIPSLMKTAPIRDAEGNILYCVGQIQDIRERLKIERMKDEFISVISHELRTPLTSIRGALGILNSGIYANRPEKAQHMLEIALNNSDRLVRLINEILDLERLQSGKVELLLQPCQVADLMQQSIEGVQTIADQSGITLSLSSPVSAIVWVAPDEIVQTLTNLLVNAIKFSLPGGTVALKAELQVLDDSSLLLSVADQGRGIPADKLDIIFEQFQQVDVSDSRKRGGTGLGLAICKNIVQQHGGKIWAESQIGHGSTFYFTLPLKS